MVRGKIYDTERLLKKQVGSINNCLNVFLAPVEVIALCPRIAEIIDQISEPKELLGHDD